MGIGQRLQQKRIRHTENCRIRPDADAQRQQNHRRHTRALLQDAQTIAKVFGKLFPSRDPTPFAALLPDLLGPRQCYPRLPHCLLLSSASASIFFSLAVQVVSQFLVHLSIHLLAAEQSAHPVTKITQHLSSSRFPGFNVSWNQAISSTWPTAAASLRQASVSVSSCLRPIE